MQASHNAIRRHRFVVLYKVYCMSKDGHNLFVKRSLRETPLEYRRVLSHNTLLYIP